jgi:hypothetical protein
VGLPKDLVNEPRLVESFLLRAPEEESVVTPEKEMPEEVPVFLARKLLHARVGIARRLGGVPGTSLASRPAPASSQGNLQTVQELMAAAVFDEQARPGMVVAIQTFSDNLKWNPHLHCVVSRGVWLADGQWIPVPYVSTHAAEILFREKVFRLLQQHELVSDERIQLLRSWRRSGFSVDNDVYLYPSDGQALETLCRYIVRCPVSLQRLHYDNKTNYVLYQPRSENRKAELLNPLEFLARVLIHIPEPNQHSILYYGHYARRRKKSAPKNRPADNDGEFNATKRKVLRRRWANLIRRVLEA